MPVKQAVKHQNRIILFLLAFSLSVFFSACGKRKPPLPPFEKVLQKVQISGFQRGNQVRLSWTMPERNANSGNLLNIERVDVYRLVENITSDENLTEEEFTNRSTLIASFPVTETDFAKKTLNYFDTLQFAGQNVRLRYAVRFVNSTGSKAAFSNFLQLEPTGKVAGYPTLSRPELSENRILLIWQSPEFNIDGSKPANILGYNVYRASRLEKTAKLINQTPVTENKFADESFDFGIEYQYFIRSVSLGTNAELIESKESNIVELLPKDTFPPSPPTAITIAASLNAISIFFVPNLEKDVVGYKVYRSNNKVNWQLLNDKLLEKNTYQDNIIEAGKTYYYYLTAVDRFANESEKSEIVSEIVP